MNIFLFKLWISKHPHCHSNDKNNCIHLIFMCATSICGTTKMGLATKVGVFNSYPFWIRSVFVALTACFFKHLQSSYNVRFKKIIVVITTSSFVSHNFLSDKSSESFNCVSYYPNVWTWNIENLCSHKKDNLQDIPLIWIAPHQW